MREEKGHPRKGRLVEEEEEVGEGEASEDSSGGTQELVQEVQVWVWARSGGRVGSLPVAIMEAEKPWGSWAMAFKANMMPGIWSTQVREGVPSSKRAQSILFMVR